MKSHFRETSCRDNRDFQNNPRLLHFASGERIERDDAENELPGQKIDD